MQQVTFDSISVSKVNDLTAIISRALTSLESPHPLKLSEWADQHFYLSPESSSVAGRWETLPYQKAIMNAMSNDDIEIVTWKKSARVGYTKCFCAAVGYFAEHKKRNQVIYQPTDSDAEDFAKDEIDTLIRDVPCVRDTMKTDPEKKSKDNTITKKSFVGSTLDIKGGKSARNYRRLTKDVVYYDELDGFDHDVDGEGSATSLGDTRITTSSFPKSIRGSTPRQSGLSQIEASFEEADLQFYRHYNCPHCNTWHQLRWSGMTWMDNDSSTVHHACEHCGGMIHYSQIAELDKVGQWRTEQGQYINENDLFFNDKNKKIDPPRHIAFHIWAGYSYFTTWPQLVAEFLIANKSAKEGNVSRLKTFVNTKLGESWSEQGEQVDHETLISRRESYTDVKDNVKLLTGSVDVQGDRLEVLVIGWLKGYENYHVDHIILMGDPSKGAVWDELTATLRTQYLKENGTPIGIHTTCIDSGGHHTQIVYDYVKRRKVNRLYAIKGMAGEGRAVANPRDIIGYPHKRKVIMVGVDTAKAMIYSLLKVRDVGAGYCHFNMTCDEEYFLQLTAEKLITKFIRGFPVKEWLKTRARNEILDLMVYSLAALILSGINVNKNVVINTPTVIKKIDPKPQQIEQPRPKKKRRKGWQ